MPDPTTTVQQMDLLRKEGVALVDDYRRALEGKLLSNQDPESVRAPYERRYTTWVRKVDALAKDLASDWGTLIKRSVRSEMDRLYTRAKNAYRARGKVEGSSPAATTRRSPRGSPRRRGRRPTSSRRRSPGRSTT